MISVLQGDVRQRLHDLADGSVNTVMTSPPYFGLRDYGVAGQIGLEPTPDAFVAEMVAVFDEVRRVLRDDGTLWLNLGDSYAGSWGAQSRGGPPSESSTLKGNGHIGGGPKIKSLSAVQIANAPKTTNTGTIRQAGLKPKDLMGIPWRVAFALQAAGWYLRQDIIWHKPNPMPESVTDRCTKAHEYIFLFSKSPSYYFDSAAMQEPASFPEGSGNRKAYAVDGQRKGDNANLGGGVHKIGPRATRNKRSVWTVTTKGFKGAHFATFPPDLIEPCILAGCPIGGTVLDPFFGAGTTGLVAQQHGRNCIGIELNPEYVLIATQRLGLGVFA